MMSGRRAIYDPARNNVDLYTFVMWQIKDVLGGVEFAALSQSDWHCERATLSETRGAGGMWKRFAS